jgi:undecaprenyl-diphosphatase
MVVGCTSFAVAGSINIYRHHALDVERYAVRSITPTMGRAEWWETGWTDSPQIASM